MHDPIKYFFRYQALMNYNPTSHTCRHDPAKHKCRHDLAKLWCGYDPAKHWCRYDPACTCSPSSKVFLKKWCKIFNFISFVHVSFLLHKFERNKLKLKCQFNNSNLVLCALGNIYIYIYDIFYLHCCRWHARTTRNDATVPARCSWKIWWQFQFYWQIDKMETCREELENWTIPLYTSDNFLNVELTT